MSGTDQRYGAEAKEQSSSEELINQTWLLLEQIDKGSYGLINIGLNRHTNERVAIKREPKNIDKQKAQLSWEYQILKLINGPNGEKGFPRVYYFGEFKGYHVMVMDLLGKNLEKIFNMCGRKFSLKTIIFITLQLLKRFRVIHKKNILYRDVKPENFCLGLNSNTIHVIDFGLSTKLIDETTGKHVQKRKTNEIIGTTRYMSLNAHRCLQQSRRDDLESVCYVIIYFLRQGQLPWSGRKIRCETFQQYNTFIYQIKRNITDSVLFSLPDNEPCPEEFPKMFRYVRSLRFDQEPDYERLRLSFKKLFYKNPHFKDDGIYDWNVPWNPDFGHADDSSSSRIKPKLSATVEQ